MKIILLIIFLVFTTTYYAGIGDGTSTEGALPVELTSFTASTNSYGVILNWTTATEVDNYGFEIERALSRQVGTTPRQDEWENIGFVRGHGNSNSPKNYSFVDDEPLTGKILYRLKQIDTDGGFEYSSIIEIRSGSVPEKFILMQNYPNPFSKGAGRNSKTIIRYSIPEGGEYVTLKIYDVLGNEMAVLVNKRQDAGKYKISFNSESLSSGVYFYRLTAENYTATRKMIILN